MMYKYYKNCIVFATLHPILNNTPIFILSKHLIFPDICHPQSNSKPQLLHKDLREGAIMENELW
jgi:hypothetical protein